MRAFIFASGADTGGQGFRIAEAFTRHAPEWRVDSLALARKFMLYPEQAETPHRAWDRGRMARQLYGEADVIHLRLTLAGWEQMDQGRGKPVILHHHGSVFRQMHTVLAARARRIGAVQIASTIDLTMLEPDVAWLPSPFDLDALAAMRVPHPPAAIRIAHAPTSRAVKGTAHLETAVRRLQKEGGLRDIELDVIEGRPWQECLARKAEADIYVDQLALGYGNNAVEAWALGLPVIAGVADPAVRARMEATWGKMPFLEATPATLTDRLREMIQSAGMRRDYAAFGWSHAQRWHDERYAVGMLREMYETAPRTVHAPVGPITGRMRRALAVA